MVAAGNREGGWAEGFCVLEVQPPRLLAWRGGMRERDLVRPDGVAIGQGGAVARAGGVMGASCLFGQGEFETTYGQVKFWGLAGGEVWELSAGLLQLELTGEAQDTWGWGRHSAAEEEVGGHWHGGGLEAEQRASRHRTWGVAPERQACESPCIWT